MYGTDGALFPYCDMYGLEIVDGCATYDSMDRLYSTVPDQFARLIEKGLIGARHDDDGIVAEDAEYALKLAHEGRIRLYE